MDSSMRSNVIAMDKSTGNKEWQYSVSTESSTRPPIVIGDTVVFREDRTDTGYHLRGLDRNTGAKCWKHELPVDETDHYPGPLINRGEIIYDVSSDGKVTAIEIPSNETLWTRNAATEGRIKATALSGDKLYFGGENGQICCVDCETGGRVWKADDAGAIRTLSIGDELVLSGCEDDGKIEAYDSETGRRVWTHPLPGVTSRNMAVAEELLYVGTNAGTIHAIDMRGEQWWEFQTDEIGSHGWISKKLLPGYRLYGVTGSPSVTEDVVLFGSDDGKLYALDAKTGELLWKQQLFESETRREDLRSGIWCQPVVDDGIIYLMDYTSTRNETKEGYVYALTAPVTGVRENT